MSDQKIQVDISVATYKRPLLLSTMLESLAMQVLPPTTFMRIIVVDNDVNESARGIVEKFANSCKWPVVYDVEPEQNIALTRNRGLSHTTGNFVVFIDDDEYADPNWLGHLLQTSAEYKADVVFGPVLSVYPENTPRWILDGGFFERPRYISGSSRPHGATNNTLIKGSCLNGHQLWFNPAFGLTGGEDVDFFLRLAQRGARLIWCDEALVYEPVPFERMTISWLTGRALRGGQVVGRIFKRPLPFVQKSMWFVQRLIYLVIALIALPFAWVCGRARGVKVLQKVYSSFGQITSLGSIYYREYKQ